MSITLSAYAESILALERQSREQLADGQKKKHLESLHAIVRDCTGALRLPNLGEGDRQWLDDKMTRAQQGIDTASMLKRK